MRRMARISGRTAVREARIKGRTTRQLSKVQQRAAVRTARATRRLGVTTAGYRARQLHKTKSPAGRTHRIYKGKKQKWSKKYGGWVNEKSYRRKAPSAPEPDAQQMIKDLMPLILLLKGVA